MFSVQCSMLNSQCSMFKARALQFSSTWFGSVQFSSLPFRGSKKRFHIHTLLQAADIKTHPFMHSFIHSAIANRKQNGESRKQKIKNIESMAICTQTFLVSFLHFAREKKEKIMRRKKNWRMYNMCKCMWNLKSRIQNLDRE